VRDTDGVRRARARESAVAEMLVRHVRVIAIGRTLYRYEQQCHVSIAFPISLCERLLPRVISPCRPAQDRLLSAFAGLDFMLCTQVGCLSTDRSVCVGILPLPVCIQVQLLLSSNYEWLSTCIAQTNDPSRGLDPDPSGQQTGRKNAVVTCLIYARPMRRDLCQMTIIEQATSCENGILLIHGRRLPSRSAVGLGRGGGTHSLSSSPYPARSSGCSTFKDYPGERVNCRQTRLHKNAFVLNPSVSRYWGSVLVLLLLKKFSLAVLAALLYLVQHHVFF